MDNKLLLVKAITLMYLNGKTEDKSSDALDTVKDVLEVVKPKDKFVQAEFGSDPVSDLRDILVDMCSRHFGYEFDEAELKQRFKVALRHEEYLYDALIAGFVLDSEPKENINKMISHQKNTIRSHLNKTKIGEIMKQWYLKTAYHADTIDHRTLLQELTESLAPYTSSEASTEDPFNHPGIVNDISFKEKDGLAKALVASKDELDTRGVIRTPYQGLNRMLGRHGGLRRGETVVPTALSHNYKSGLVMDIFMGCALFNKPYMRDPSKKPLNLRISFENTIMQDLSHMYPKLKESEEKVKVDMNSIDVESATDYLMDRLNTNGYESKIIHIEPSDFTYYDLFKVIERLEDDGYEIHLLTVDYLNMMSKSGCADGPAGENIRDLFRRVRNFCLRRGITFVSPHQFSTEARKLERGEPKDFVKHVSARGYYDGCSRLEQELDLEISLHIVVVNNEKYLTMQRGKHRGVVTDPRDLYCVYKFEEFGGIPMDVLGQDKSRKHIAGTTMSEGGEAPWFDEL